MAIDNETRERAKAYVAAQSKKAVEQQKDVVPVKQEEDKVATTIAIKSRELSQRDYTAAKRIAIKLIKQSEGCELRAYPDVASPLGEALIQRGLWRKYLDGKFDIPKEWEHLSGAPWTAMYGETQGVEQGMTFTQDEAEERLSKRVDGFMAEVLKASPVLAKHSDEKLAAIVSLVYNIGLTQYGTSTVRKRIAAEDFVGAGDAITWFNKAQGKVNQGLINRRDVEKKLFLSQTN